MTSLAPKPKSELTPEELAQKEQEVQHGTAFRPNTVRQEQHTSSHQLS